MGDNKGMVYLIQPAELIGTNRYKIGRSGKNDLLRCINGYKKGSRIIRTAECNNPPIVELEIKKAFNKKFKLIAGKEYFEGNEEEIIKEFNDIVLKFSKVLIVEELKENTLNFEKKNFNYCCVPFPKYNICTKTWGDEVLITMEELNKRIHNNNIDEYFSFICEYSFIPKALRDIPNIFICALFKIDEDIKEIENENINHYDHLFENAFEFYIDCSENFSKEEQDIIKNLKIKSLNDLLRYENLPSYDKSRALECYKYVSERFKFGGFEPVNGNVSIQFGEFLFVIKILNDKTIKFIQSAGKKTHNDFVHFQYKFN
jgi:hypothetical protein